jgi:DUF1680 family protein
MKTFSVVFVLTVGSVATTAQGPPAPADYAIRPVPLAQVKVTGGFWQTKLETNRTVTIPHILRQNEITGRVDNLRKGAGKMAGEYQGRRFNDTDVYKIIEAASYSLVSRPDPELATQLDALIALIAGAQQPDGYLFPARTINPAKPAAGVGTERWQYENTGSHELYNSGHLYEAAVAHFRATGSRSLLDVAVKNANLVNSVFGPSARKDAPGHEEIELALVKLYRATNDVRYLQLSKFFLDQRGTAHNAPLNYTDPAWSLYNDRLYRQDDKPLVDQLQAQGHAVRATYVYNAMTDIATMLRDPAYGRAVDRLWTDVYTKRAYLTGGLGSISGTEAFGDDYALPNRSAYTETCASVGAVLWNHRMFLKSGDAKYLDAFEQTLYNGLLSGVSVAGNTFFYRNPLESTQMSPNNGRPLYFDVACCPANLSRLLAQLPGLVYSQTDNDVYVNLYMNSEADVKIKGGTAHVRQTTNYPWDGVIQVGVTADRPMTFPLKLRVPGWTGPTVFAGDLYRFSAPVAQQATYGVAGATSRTVVPGWVTVNVEITPAAVTSKTAIAVRVQLPMPVRRVLANPLLKEDAGKAAIQRGPVLYCLEGMDNGGSVLDTAVPMTTTFTPSFKSDVAGGVTMLAGAIPATAGGPARTVTAIPYFAWANRGRGEMVVWVKR